MHPEFSFDEDALLSHGSPFQPLSGQIEPHDARDGRSLHAGFMRVLRGGEAKTRRSVVFLWTVAKPYRHFDGTGGLSRIVYVEKTDGSIFGRWPPRYISLLTAGADSEAPGTADNLRALAIHASNGLFYRTVISNFGPLQVWWSDVMRLNEKLGCGLRTPREWEHLILRGYRTRNQCLPLKNRKC